MTHFKTRDRKLARRRKWRVKRDIVAARLLEHDYEICDREDARKKADKICHTK